MQRRLNTTNMSPSEKRTLLGQIFKFGFLAGFSLLGLSISHWWFLFRMVADQTNDPVLGFLFVFILGFSALAAVVPLQLLCSSAPRLEQLIQSKARFFFVSLVVVFACGSALAHEYCMARADPVGFYFLTALSMIILSAVKLISTYRASCYVGYLVMIQSTVATILIIYDGIVDGRTSIAVLFLESIMPIEYIGAAFWVTCIRQEKLYDDSIPDSTLPVYIDCDRNGDTERLAYKMR